MFWFSPSSLLPHHSLCLFLFVMKAADRGRQHLEDIRLRQIEIRSKSQNRGKDSAAEAKRIGDKNSRLRAHPKGSGEEIDSPLSSF